MAGSQYTCSECMFAFEVPPDAIGVSCPVCETPVAKPQALALSPDKGVDRSRVILVGGVALGVGLVALSLYLLFSDAGDAAKDKAAAELGNLSDGELMSKLVVSAEEGSLDDRWARFKFWQEKVAQDEAAAFEMLRKQRAEAREQARLAAQDEERQKQQAEEAAAKAELLRKQLAQAEEAARKAAAEEKRQKELLEKAESWLRTLNKKREPVVSAPLPPLPPPEKKREPGATAPTAIPRPGFGDEVAEQNRRIRSTAADKDAGIREESERARAAGKEQGAKIQSETGRAKAAGKEQNAKLQSETERAKVADNASTAELKVQSERAKAAGGDQTANLHTQTQRSKEANRESTAAINAQTDGSKTGANQQSETEATLRARQAAKNQDATLETQTNRTKTASGKPKGERLDETGRAQGADIRTGYYPKSGESPLAPYATTGPAAAEPEPAPAAPQSPQARELHLHEFNRLATGISQTQKEVGESQNRKENYAAIRKQKEQEAVDTRSKIAELEKQAREAQARMKQIAEKKARFDQAIEALDPQVAEQENKKRQAEEKLKELPERPVQPSKIQPNPK